MLGQYIDRVEETFLLGDSLEGWTGKTGPSIREVGIYKRCILLFTGRELFWFGTHNEPLCRSRINTEM